MPSTPSAKRSPFESGLASSAGSSSRTLAKGGSEGGGPGAAPGGGRRQTLPLKLKPDQPGGVRRQTLPPDLKPDQTEGFDDYNRGGEELVLGEDSTLNEPEEVEPPAWTLGWGRRGGGRLPPMAIPSTPSESSDSQNNNMTTSTKDVFTVTTSSAEAEAVQEFQDAEFMWNQETPRKTQDMTRSWVAGEKDLEERRGGGRSLLRESEVDSNEYGFGRGLRNIQQMISRLLRGQPHSEAKALIEQIRAIKEQEGYPLNLAERIDDMLAENGAPVSLKDCHDFVHRVGIFTHPLLKLELLVEEVFTSLQASNKHVTFNRVVVVDEDEEEETILLNQAGLRMKTGHYHTVTCLAMSPDGALLATADEGGTIVLWGLNDGEQQRRQHHDGPVVAMAFTHSEGKKAGDVLLSVGADRSLKALDVATWVETLNVGDIHDDLVTDMAAVHNFAPVCATSSADSTVRVWGLGTAAEIGVGDEDTWDVQPGIKRVGSGITGAYIVPKFDSEVVESYLRDHPAFDDLGDDEISALTNGLAVHQYDALERIYSEAESTEINQFYIMYEGAAFETQGAFSPEGPMVTHYYAKGEVFGERESLGNYKAREASVTCSQSSVVLSCPRDMYNRLMQGGDWMNEFLDVYEAANMPLRRTRTSNLTNLIPKELLLGREGDHASSPGSPKRTSSASSADNGVTGIFAKIKRMDRVKERLKRRVALRRSDDLKRACALFSRSVKMPHGKWRLLQTLKGHEDVVSCVAIDAKGRVASGSQDMTVRLWQGNRKETLTSTGGGSLMEGWAKGQECVATMKGHTMWVSCVAFAKEDTLLLTGSLDETVQIWSAEEGSEGRKLRSFGGSRGWLVQLREIGTVCVNIENKGGVLRVWDLDSGKEVAEMQSRRELQFDAFTGLAASADGIFTAFGEGRNVVLIDATASRGIDQMAVPGPGRVTYLEDLTYRIGLDPRVPAVVMLKGVAGADVHAELEERCSKEAAEKAAELKKDAKAVKDVSTVFLDEYMKKNFQEENENHDAVNVKVREYFTQEGSLWLGGEYCDVQLENLGSVVTCHSAAKQCVVCTEPMLRGRYMWDIRMEGSGHGGFAKGVSFGIVSTNMSFDEVVSLEKGTAGIETAGGSVFVMRSSLGKVTVPAGCIQLGPDADVWAPMPKKKVIGEEQEGEGDQAATLDEGPAKPLRIKELGMQGDRVQMGFSTFTRIFWIHTMPKNGGDSIFKCEIPASCVPVLDWKQQKGDNALKIVPIVQLEGEGWNMWMSTLEHEIAVKPSLRKYAQMLSDAFDSSKIRHEEVVKFKGQTLTVDCQPWLPPGEGLVGGRDVTLIVPRGAISQSVKLSITVCNPPRGSDEFVSAKATAGRDVFEQGRIVGVAVDIQPHGLVFDRPAILTIPHAAVLKDDEMDWLEEAEMVQMNDFYTVQKVATGTMRTLPGGTFDSRNAILPIRETGIYAIKASHNVMDLVDMDVLPMDDEDKQEGSAVPYNIRKLKRNPGSPVSAMSPVVRSPSGSKSGSPRGRGRGTWKRSQDVSLKSRRRISVSPDGRRSPISSVAALGTTLTASFRFRMSPASRKKAKSPAAMHSKKDITKESTKDVKKEVNLQGWLRPDATGKISSPTPGGPSGNLKHAKSAVKLTALHNRTQNLTPHVGTTSKIFFPKSGTGAVTNALSNHVRSDRYTEDLLDLPDVFVGEPAVKLRFIVCSPLCQDPLFRHVAYGGSNTLPYSSIITNVGVRQDKHLLGAALSIGPTDFSYTDKAHGVLSEWRGSPVALELEMGARRLADSVTSAVLDEPSNWDQSVTLVLSLRGVVGDDVRETADVWKDGEYAQLTKLARKREENQIAQFCSLGPFSARVARVDPLEKVKRATHHMHIARLLGGKKMGSRANAKNKNITLGWDVLMVSEDERNVLMQHKLILGLSKLGWTVRRSPPLWGEDDDLPSNSGATEQAMRAAELASACKATVIFLTPSFYQKISTATQEMQLVRAVLRFHGESHGGMIVPILLPPYAGSLDDATVRDALVRMRSDENATDTDPWAGVYGSRLKSFANNAVSFREDHDELCKGVHRKLLEIVKSGPYGSEEERREFFSPMKNAPLPFDPLLSLPSEDYTQRVPSSLAPHAAGLVAQSGHHAAVSTSLHGHNQAEAEVAENEQVQRWEKQRAGVLDFLNSMYLGRNLHEEMKMQDFMAGLMIEEQDMWHMVREEQGVQIDPDEGENVQTVAELVQIIQSRLPA